MRYYPFMINLDRCNGSCNTLDDPSDKICVPNETENLNLRVFNIKIGINESMNVRVSGKIKKNMCAIKIIFGILLHVLVKVVNI